MRQETCTASEDADVVSITACASPDGNGVCYTTNSGSCSKSVGLELNGTTKLKAINE